jgi:hypothetical protein
MKTKILQFIIICLVTSNLFISFKLYDTTKKTNLNKQTIEKLIEINNVELNQIKLLKKQTYLHSQIIYFLFQKIQKMEFDINL